MTEKRFTTSGYYIYDHYKEDRWLVNEVEAQYIVDKMNNLDTKARENSKALSTLQQKLNALHEDLETHKQYCKTLGLGITKIMQSIKEDREDKALVMCLTLLKKLEEEGLLE